MANIVVGGYVAFNASLEIMNHVYFHDSKDKGHDICSQIDGT